MKLFTFISALLISASALAAHRGEIAIQSGSGETFYVVLDGQYQNYHPQTRVNMDASANNLYNVKVYSASNQFVFDRNIVVQPDRRMNYRIINRRGHYQLIFASEEPLNTYGASSCGIMHPMYGNESHGTPNNYGYANNYMSGMNLLSGADFDNLKRAIQQESFSDDKLRVAKRAARNKRMTTAQIKEITRLFSFSSERLEFAKVAYDNCVNPQNYYEVFEVLTFSSEKRALEAYIDAH